jgi:hypothetical protein
LTFLEELLYLYKLLDNQPNTVMKKLLRKYSDPIAIHKDYIDVLLRLAGYRLSELAVTILAYSSYRKALTADTKKEIAEKFETSTQVISNSITKLRKQQLLLRNNINPKLKPESDFNCGLTIYFTTPKATKVEKIAKVTEIQAV